MDCSGNNSRLIIIFLPLISFVEMGFLINETFPGILLNELDFDQDLKLTE